jgi:hypothetical protein
MVGIEISGTIGDKLNIKPHKSISIGRRELAKTHEGKNYVWRLSEVS